MTAFNQALALESSTDLPYDQTNEKFIISHDELCHYAAIVAYKVAHNLSNGHKMDPAQDPLTYVDCTSQEVVDSAHK